MNWLVKIRGDDNKVVLTQLVYLWPVTHVLPVVHCVSEIIVALFKKKNLL